MSLGVDVERPTDPSGHVSRALKQREFVRLGIEHDEVTFTRCPDLVAVIDHDAVGADCLCSRCDHDTVGADCLLSMRDGVVGDLAGQWVELPQGSFWHHVVGHPDVAF